MDWESIKVIWAYEKTNRVTLKVQDIDEFLLHNVVSYSQKTNINPITPKNVCKVSGGTFKHATVLVLLENIQAVCLCDKPK